MKKKVLVLLLSVVLASSSITTVPVLAVETTEAEATSEEAVPEHEESIKEQEKFEQAEEADVGLLTEDASEEELAQVVEEVDEQIEEVSEPEEEPEQEKEVTESEDGLMEEKTEICSTERNDPHIQANNEVQGSEKKEAASAKTKKTDSNDSDEKAAEEEKKVGSFKKQGQTFEGSISFEANILCTIGKNSHITAEVTLPEGETVNNAVWSCNDDSALIFSGTSTQGPSATGQDGVYWVSVMIHAFKAGDYQVTLHINDTISNNVTVSIGEDVRIGKLTGYSGETITIDYTGYSVTEDCDINYTSAWDNKDVFFSVEDGKVKCVRLVSDVIIPKLTLRASPDSFVYENGFYNENCHTLIVTVGCSVSRYSPFSRSAVERIATERKLSVYKHNLQLTGDYLNFGKEGVLFKKDIETINSDGIQLSLGQSISTNYAVYIKEDMVPAQTNTTVQVEGSITLSDGTIYEDKEYLNLYVINLDLQKAAAEEAQRNQKTEAAATVARRQLQQCSAISLDASLMEYLSEQQIAEIEDYLIIYMAKVLTADKVEDYTIFDKIDDHIRTKVKNKILSALHISKSTLLGSKTTKGSTYVSCTTFDGERIVIDFTIKIDEYTIGERDPYGSFASIDYRTTIGGRKIEGSGIATLANLRSFADSMLDFLKISYDNAWGKKANEIAAMFDAKPIDWLLNGDYSGKIYEISVDATKAAVMKKAVIQCPVDVDVYDADGNLCAQIVNNKVVQSSDLVGAAVNDDDKIIYYAGADYTILLKGTDTGSMKYTVLEMADGEVLREFKQESIPLTPETEYEAILPAGKYTDKEAYAIYDDSEEIVGEITDSLPEDRSASVPIGIHFMVENDRKLTIFGEGSTGDYTKYDPQWQEYADRITEVVIQPGFTEIGNYSFYQFNNIRSVEIPLSISVIGKGAFYECKKLSELDMPASITRIDEAAFWNCAEYAPEELPEELTYLESIAFAGSGVQRIRLGEKLHSIGDNVFYGSPLEEVYIDCREISKANNIFSGCESLREIYVGTSVESLGEDGCGETSTPFMGIEEGVITVADDNMYYSSENGIVFNKDRSKLVHYPCWRQESEYTVPNSVTVIGSRAFSKARISNINLPNGLTIIRDYAFFGCKELTELIIPDTVEQIGKGMAYDCEKLVRAELPEGLTEVPAEAFRSCDSLSWVVLPESVEVIGDDCFMPFGTSSLREIHLPGNLVSIGESAFQNTKIEVFDIPDSVKSIGTDAFLRSGKTKVVFHGNSPDFSKGCIETVVLYMSALYIYYPSNNPSWSDGVLEALRSCENGSEEIYLCGYGDGGVVEQEKFELDSREYTVGINEYINIVSRIVPENATNQNVFFKPRNYYWDEYVDYDQKGVITGLKEGRVDFDVYSIDSDYSEMITVYITADNTPVSSIQLDKESVVIAPGEVVTLKATVLPSDASDQSIIWTSSNEKAATVSSNGEVKGINVGTSTITAATVDGGKQASCSVTVTKTSMILPGKTTRADMFNLANNVKVTWKEVPGAKYYKVYRSGVKDPVIVTSALVGYDKTAGLENGKKYTYKIVASTTGKGDSSGDSTLSYSKVMYRLKTVAIRSVKNTAAGKVTVKYDKTTSGDSYVLQYGERQDMVGAKTKVVLGANNTSYTIGGLKKGKTYYISIRVRKKVNGIDYYTTFGVAKKVTITK